MYSRVRSMASSRNRTVKPWNSIQIEEEDVQFLETLVLTLFNRVKNCSWQLCIKAWQAFQFICIQRTRISFMKRDQLNFFHSLRLILKNLFFFLAQKYNLKKRQQPKFSNIKSSQPYLSFICSIPFWTNKGILHFYLAGFRLCPNASV